MPTAIEPRLDIPIEVSTTLDASGGYTGDWIDSRNVVTARVLYYFTLNPAPYVNIEESIDGVTPLLPGGNQVTNGGTANITGRYFRLIVTGGGNGATFRASVRAV